MYLFGAGVPQYAVWTLLTIIMGIVVCLYLTKKDWYSFFQNTLLCLLLGYISFVLCITLLFREGSCDVRFFIQPFWSYHVLNYKSMAQLVLNVLLFVPLGGLSAAVMRRTKWFVLAGYACCFSLMIEVVQLVSRRGVFNIDDIIHNTIGFVFGYCLFRICFIMIR